MTNLYYGTVKQLLERISSVMVDYEAISHLIVFVKEALNGEAILEELGKSQIFEKASGFDFSFCFIQIFENFNNQFHFFFRSRLCHSG